MEESIVTPSTPELELRFPGMPQTLLKAMELSRSTDLDVEETMELVLSDPAAVARILRVANSAFHGQKNEVTSIRRAIVALGSPSVVGLVMSMSLLQMQNALNDKTMGPFLHLVRHSIATAYLAQNLATLAPKQPASRSAKQDYLNDAFTAGLLHDFGKIVLLMNSTEEALDFYTIKACTLDSAKENIIAEQEQFGIDHQQAGGLLAEKSGFSDVLKQCMTTHHFHTIQESPGIENEALVTTVSAANLVANTFGVSFGHTLSWDECFKHPVWDRMIELKLVPFTNRDPLFEVLGGMKEPLFAYLETVI